MTWNFHTLRDWIEIYTVSQEIYSAETPVIARFCIIGSDHADIANLEMAAEAICAHHNRENAHND